jgi:hypothetical protein
MMNNTNEHPGPTEDAGATGSPAMDRLMTALQVVCAPAAPPRAAQLDAAIITALHVGPSASRRASAPRRWLRTGLLARLAALAALIAAAVGGTAVYLIGQSPAPASAQAVLTRAAAASRLAPHEAAHLTYTLSPHVPGRGGGLAGPMEVWLQAGARGETARFAFTQTIYANGVVAVVQRMVLVGGTGRSYVYDPRANAVAISPASTQQLGVGGLQIFDPSSVAAYLARAARDAPRQARLLPQQTIDGALVNVVRLPADPMHDNPAVTAYFDARTFLFRGADLVSGSYTLHWRVSRYDLVAASAVPSGTFALHVPPSAHAVSSVPIPEFVPGD